MNFNLSDKTFLVTGGTRGIGAQIANDLYELGAKVLITGTNKSEINNLNNDFRYDNGRKIFFYLDFLDKNCIEVFLDEIISFYKIDGFVNNAGINILNSIQDAKLTDWNDMLAVNLTAPFQLLNALTPKMITQKYGRIVNIASIFGVISKEKRVVYSATKFGIHGLTVGSSNDLARYNILVNTVSPGFVLTDLTMANLSKEEIATLIEKIPIRRMAETSDISKLVLFLLSDLNQYITGQNIIIDGGFTNI